MVELPKTDAELQAIIDSEVSKALESKVKELESKHNGAIASLRKKYADDLETERAKLNGNVDDLANQKATELNASFMEEYNRLKSFEKSTVITQRLAKEGLPEYFKNDSRLLNSTDADFDKTLKEVRKEYEATLPKGNLHSSVVQQSGNTPQPTNKDIANEKMAEALAQIVGR